MEDGNWGSQTSIDHEEAQTDYNTLQMLGLLYCCFLSKYSSVFMFLEDLANGGNSNRVHQQNDEYIEETGTASSQSSIMSFDNSQS